VKDLEIEPGGVWRTMHPQYPPIRRKPWMSPGAWGSQDEGCHLSGTREGFLMGLGCSPRPHRMSPWTWGGRLLVE
jgi:hypothetical protein